jgi:hypothetical protein
MNELRGAVRKGNMISSLWSMVVWIVVALSSLGFMLSNLKELSFYLLHDEAAVSASVRGKNNGMTTDAGKFIGDEQNLEQKVIEQLQQEVKAASVREEWLEMQRIELDRQLQEVLKQAKESSQSSKTDREFPYRLACPGTNLKSPSERNYTITLAYHVGIVKNYKSVVTDQMETLDQCGLGKAASNFILSYSGGELEDVQSLTRPYNLFVNESGLGKPTTIVRSTEVPWEGPAMNLIYDHCHSRTVKDVTSQKPTIVFYFHNKGVSTWTADWQDYIDRKSSYSHSLYWRKYMEYFIFERPELCIDQIINKGAGSCGVHWLRHHYSGNFWAANCDYVRQLSPINMSVHDENFWTDYLQAEMWIGGKRDNKEGRRPHSLHQIPGGTSLYRLLVKPSEYSDYNARWGKAMEGDSTIGAAKKV